MLKDKDFLEIANIHANASYCNRKKVGAVLVSIDRRIIGSGYNGNPSGMCNECEDDEGVTKNTVLHAECNALLFATREDLSGSTMYVTLSPCLSCAAMMIQRGVARVVYLEQYRNIDALYLLRDNNIRVDQHYPQ